MITQWPDHYSAAEQNFLGPIPSDDQVCVSLCDSQGENLLESYVYEIGFFRFNWHSSLELMLVLSGNLTAYTEDGNYELETDDFLVINSNVGHATILRSPKTTALCLHISRAYLEHLCGKGSIPQFCCCSSAAGKVDHWAQALIRSCMSGIYLALSTEKEHRQLLAVSQVQLLVSVLLQKYSKPVISRMSRPSHIEQKNRIHEMIRYVNRHFREQISLNDLAGILKMNDSYLSSYFKAHIGINFHEYLTRKRLAYAAYLLHNTEDSVLEIAGDAGFPDGKALNQAFKKYFNISPREYRKKLTKGYAPTVKNLFPVRLACSDPMVQEKLGAYIQESITFADFYQD